MSGKNPLVFLSEEILKDPKNRGVQSDYNGFLREAGYCPINVCAEQIFIFPWITPAAGALHCTFYGAIVTASLHGIRQFVSQCLQAQRPHIIIDCAHLKPFRSIALGTFVKLANELIEAGGSLQLYHCHRNSVIVMEMLGLDKFFVARESLEDCLSRIPS